MSTLTSYVTKTSVWFTGRNLPGVFLCCLEPPLTEDTVIEILWCTLFRLVHLVNYKSEGSRSTK